MARVRNHLFLSRKRLTVAACKHPGPLQGAIVESADQKFMEGGVMSLQRRHARGRGAKRLASPRVRGLELHRRRAVVGLRFG